MSFKSILIKDSSKKKKFWKKERTFEDLLKNKFEKAPKISISGSLTKFSKKAKKPKAYTFFIVGPFFGYHHSKTNEVRYLDLTLTVLNITSSQTPKSQGFSLTRHSSNKKDFIVKNSTELENWFLKLRRFCVQPNFASHYDLEEEAGKGNFASVYKARSKRDGKLYAAKIIQTEGLTKSSKLRQAVRTEISIHRSLSHPYIVRFVEVYEDEEKIYLVSELLEGGELFERVLKRKRYSEKEAAIVMKQTMEALLYLEQKDIIHRDLKLENVLLVKQDDDCLVKVVDFGLSAMVDSVDTKVRCGTPGYVAPEVILEKPYDCKADIFSAGVMLYVLLSGCTPFPGKTFDEILSRNKKCSPKFTSKYWNDVSFEAIDFVVKLLSVDPAKRPTPAEALQSPWISATLADSMNSYSHPAEDSASIQDKSEEYKLRTSTRSPMEYKEEKITEEMEEPANILSSLKRKPRETVFSKKHSLTIQPDVDSFNRKFLKRHSLAPDLRESQTSMHKKIMQRNLLKKLETFDPNSGDEGTEPYDQSFVPNSNSRFDMKSGLFLNSFYGKGASQGTTSDTDVQTPKKAIHETQDAQSRRRSVFGKLYSIRNDLENDRQFSDDSIPEEDNVVKGMIDALKTMCFLSKPLFQHYDTGDGDLKRATVSHFPNFRNAFGKGPNRLGISFIV